MTQLPARLQAIFENNRHDFQARVTTLERAVLAILDGSLDEELRAAAERDAHKLVGSLGTFGLPEGSALARELEGRFARAHRSVMTDAQLDQCVKSLRDVLDGNRHGSHPDEQLSPTGGVVIAGSRPLAPTSVRILVVDDDEAVRLALAAILSEAGYYVRSVASAREARHALAHEPIDLLLSDVSMPGETGIDLIRFALCEHPGTATLLISALEVPGIAEVAVNFGAYGYLSKPVRRSEVLIGVMNALRRRDIEARERATCEKLEQLVALRTSALTEALARVEGAARQGRDLEAATIHRWAQSAEHREPGIAGHVERVSGYCTVLGRAFGLDADALGLASVLHDVGKHAIPDSILLKRGPLTIAERLAIETHAETGYDMLRGSCSTMLDLAAVIARTHHERFDGTGYPHGLTGTEIPIEGRIAAVADVFDALTSDRVYRAAWSVQSAVGWMMGESEKHFDPGVLGVFTSSIDEVRAVRSLLACT